jgi:ATP adenylyltransferase
VTDEIIDRGAGDPDRLQRLWTPHRMSYIVEAPNIGGSSGSSQPFTDIPNMSDEDGLVVARGELVYAVLNLYPYNPGHLMVVPYRKVSELEDLTDAESAGDQGGFAPRRLQRRAQPRPVGGWLARRAPAHARGAPMVR